MTPLQHFRARMRRLSAIATECGLEAVAATCNRRASEPRSTIDACHARWLRYWARTEGRFGDPMPVAGTLLLQSAADEVDALLRAEGEQ